MSLSCTVVSQHMYNKMQTQYYLAFVCLVYIVEFTGKVSDRVCYTNSRFVLSSDMLGCGVTNLNDRQLTKNQGASSRHN